MSDCWWGQHQTSDLILGVHTYAYSYSHAEGKDGCLIVSLYRCRASAAQMLNWVHMHAPGRGANVSRGGFFVHWCGALMHRMHTGMMHQTGRNA